MAAASNHRYFGSLRFFNEPDRVSQSLCNERCQNILYQAILEHIKEIKWIAVLLCVSKSFQNSSFGANFLVNFVIDEDSIALLESVLSPSSCLSLQFVPSLHIQQWKGDSETVKRAITNFIDELVTTKYFRLSLRSLNLDSVTAEVLSCFFGRVSSDWQKLQDLNLKHCGLHDTVMEIISNNALHVRSVRLSNNVRITDAGLEHICQISGITSLDLSFCDNIGNGGLEHISKLPGISSLILHCCDKITDAGIKHLSKLNAITTLDLSWCKSITDVGLERLSNLSNISSLNLAYSSKITDAGLEYVSLLSNITALDLGCCSNVTDAGLEHLSKLSRISSLILAYCNKITDAGIEHISRLNCITSLNLCRCVEITDAGLEHLSKLAGITSLDLTRCLKITAEARTRLAKALPKCGIVA